MRISSLEVMFELFTKDYRASALKIEIFLRLYNITTSPAITENDEDTYLE